MLAISTIGGCGALAPPLSDAEVASFTGSIAADMRGASVPHVGELDADQAVERALKYNLSIRAKELEVALAEAKVRVQAGSLLPGVVAESDYFRRDRLSASRSNASPVFSSSTPLSSVSRDISLSWNILDFGLSLVRAKQGLDRALQQGEEARRVSARIVEETRSIYWRAAALQRLVPALALLEGEVALAVKTSRAAAEDQQVDPLVPINFQRDILSLQRDLNQLKSSLASSAAELAHATGLPAVGRLRLDTRRDFARLPRLTAAAADDVRDALQQRAEIRQHMYDLRITDSEVNATLLQLLPGVTLSQNFVNDTNPFLLHSHWISWGSKIALNVMNIVRLPTDLDAIEAQRTVHRQNALATASMIAMQVHVARARVAVELQNYRDAERFARVQRDLLHQVKTAVELEKSGRQALVREKLATLLADIRAIDTFANLHAAFAAYHAARGDDPLAATKGPAHQLIRSATRPLLASAP